MSFEMADDERQRVEEPRALIPNVVNGGRQCGNSNVNLVVENSEYAISRPEKPERERDRDRDRETERHKTIVYYSIWQQPLN